MMCDYNYKLLVESRKRFKGMPAVWKETIVGYYVTGSQRSITGSLGKKRRKQMQTKDPEIASVLEL